MAFNDFMDHTAVIKTLTTSRNAIGEVIEGYTVGTAVDVRLYPQRRQPEDIQAGRTAVVDHYRLYVKGSDSIVVTQRVTMTDAKSIVPANTDFNVLHVNPIAGGDGAIHHYECDLAKID